MEEAADETRRALSTVRGLLISGALRGYKLNNRDWRIPRSALRDSMAFEAAGVGKTSKEAGEADITARRAVRQA